MDIQETKELSFDARDFPKEVWVFDADNLDQGTEISHLMMSHAEEYTKDELLVICRKAAMVIDQLRTDLAKAQAVPEGFVLIKASDRDQEMLELIDQRDHMESQAEELKDKLQALYGVDFGEHSNCNFPFQNAIDFDDSDFVLVLKEPNEEMIISGLAVVATGIGKHNIDEEIRKIWQKMIEAQGPAND